MIAEIASRYVRSFTKAQPQWRHLAADLTQEAAIGALHAQKLYENRRGDFAPFAWGWCRIFVLRYLKAQRQGTEGEKVYDPQPELEDALALPVARRLIARLATARRGPGGRSAVPREHIEAWFAMRFGDATGVEWAAKLGISRQRLYKILPLIDRDFEQLRAELHEDQPVFH